MRRYLATIIGLEIGLTLSTIIGLEPTPNNTLLSIQRVIEAAQIDAILATPCDPFALAHVIALAKLGDIADGSAKSTERNVRQVWRGPSAEDIAEATAMGMRREETRPKHGTLRKERKKLAEKIYYLQVDILEFVPWARSQNAKDWLAKTHVPPREESGGGGGSS
ncbi:hypothetical protein EDB80DRAFT_735210 [Ilyonectria destructans]|nr:hypothetical protein EDB80DRAFT_735210 [Ilyonectria destructans]